MFTPSYIELRRTGELHERVEQAYRLISPACELCPRRCGVDRLAGQAGVCRTGALPVVSSYGPHFGEEPPLVGCNGSGAIFFTSCNLRCVFCQNYEISHGGAGREVSIEELADMMLSLARQGCHNINWVTPTHQLPQILSALEVAAEAGLDIPLVYNCGGYEPVKVLALLDGVADIYMPDAKYGNNEIGRELSGVPDYWDRNQEALREMHRQVGDLALDSRGIAERGLLVRHLVLPGNLSGTREVMHFLATEISKDTYVNVMEQYRPAYKAVGHPRIGRRITSEEYAEAIRIARSEGLRRFAD
ncbi:MAG TPA: radical SAM protein [Armatimonadota bacterium]|nr:radical SAM protein [Armatimonadota bacterium]